MKLITARYEQKGMPTVDVVGNKLKEVGNETIASPYIKSINGGEYTKIDELIAIPTNIIKPLEDVELFEEYMSLI
jgi:hypothetical protein